MSSRQIVILSPEESSSGGLPPIGSRREIVDSLAGYNTSPERDGDSILWGPGFRIEMPEDDPVTQMLLTVTEDEIWFDPVVRIARAMKWKLYNPTTGQELVL